MKDPIPVYRDTTVPVGEAHVVTATMKDVNGQFISIPTIYARPDDPRTDDELRAVCEQQEGPRWR